MGTCVTKVLSSGEVERIRDESIKILTDVGTKISHPETQKKLETTGAKVDYATDLVRIPAELSLECLQKLPKSIVVAGRHAAGDAILGTGNTRSYPRTCTGCEDYIDLKTGQRRPARISDVKDWAILVENLGNMSQCTAPYYSGTGVNLNARDVHAFQILLENTTKHVLIQPYGPQNLRFCIEQALAERGSAAELKRRPRFSAHISPVPPLHYHGNTVSQMLLCGQYGIPVSLCTAPICGVAAPVTLAGGVLMAVTEFLAAVVILQTAYPGAPMIFAPRPLPVDMVSGAVLVGSVEGAIMAVALTQVAREGFEWAIDVHVAASESHSADAQTTLEKATAAVLGTCAGADIVAGAGHFESARILDPAQLMIDNEMFGMATRARRGIGVNDEALGLDVIRRIGAGVGKSYISDKHTLKHFKSEYYRPTILNRSTREEWEQGGRKDLYARAREKAMSILETHRPAPLDEAIVKELKAISEKAEKEITETTTV